MRVFLRRRLLGIKDLHPLQDLLQAADRRRREVDHLLDACQEWPESALSLVSDEVVEFRHGTVVSRKPFYKTFEAANRAAAPDGVLRLSTRFTMVFDGWTVDQDAA